MPLIYLLFLLEIPWSIYIDQCYLITHVVFTLTNWGELRLHPAMMPDEYNFIRSELWRSIRNRDIHLVYLTPLNSCLYIIERGLAKKKNKI